MPYKYLGREKAYQKKYRETHREEFRAYGKKYYHSSKGQVTRRRYLATHPWQPKEHYKIAKKRWHEDNKVRRYAMYKVYRRNNLLRMRARDQRRLSREHQAKGVITVQLIQRVYERNIKHFGTLTCYLCSKPILFGKDHLEHKTPLSRGGTNYISNLDVACQSCNMCKRNKTLKEYRRYAHLFST